MNHRNVAPQRILRPFGVTTVNCGGHLGKDCSFGCGVAFEFVFKLTPNSNGEWTQTRLHVFTNRPGSYPHASVIFDTAGNLYGTSFGDTNLTFGSVFEITP